MRRLVITAFVAGALAAGIAAWAVGGHATRVAQAKDGVGDLAALNAQFGRPQTVPFPADNPFSEKKRALGDLLFHDKRFSRDRSISCASCHQRTLGFADGRAHGKGVPGRPLKRHTPTLWNLAFAAQVFWDRRARSLEKQVAGPVESADEMALPMAELVARLAADQATAGAFAAAFPDDPRVSAQNIARAIATYERTLISPLTRFDRWIEGDEKALKVREIEGFRLFTGKAGCSNCHSGFAFTDEAFRDIGLPGEDRGRGAVLRLEKVNYAFKTPTLREITRSAPYMHDGSLKTLDEVIAHYENGVRDRPTLSADLPAKLSLTGKDHEALIAFLATLSSEGDPRPPRKVVARTEGPITPDTRVSTVTQDNKHFIPTHIALKAGARIWILNNDGRTHNVRVFDPKLEFDSGAQEPGEIVEITFPASGSLLVFCGIHPKMELWVDVAP